MSAYCPNFQCLKEIAECKYFNWAVVYFSVSLIFAFFATVSLHVLTVAVNVFMLSSNILKTVMLKQNALF